MYKMRAKFDLNLKLYDAQIETKVFRTWVSLKIVYILHQNNFEHILSKITWCNFQLDCFMGNCFDLGCGF